MDDRILLMSKLISIGINKTNAGIIALDAGSSQCIVNNTYLKEIKIEIDLRKRAIKFINQFYSGEFYES